MTEHTEASRPAVAGSDLANGVPDRRAETSPGPQSGSSPCNPTGSGADPNATKMATGLTYVYAIGQVRPFFPSPGIEKELAQVVGRADTAGLTDRQTLHTVLSQRQNRYLARQLCYVLVIEGLETYILQPRISSATPILPARSYASELHLRVHVNRTPPPPKLPFQYTELREYLSAPEMSRYKLTYQYNRLQ